jgi:hypothetical protein
MSQILELQSSSTVIIKEIISKLYNYTQIWQSKEQMYVPLKADTVANTSKQET